MEVPFVTVPNIPICGWKVLKDGKIRSEPVDMLQSKCIIGKPKGSCRDY